MYIPESFCIRETKFSAVCDSLSVSYPGKKPLCYLCSLKNRTPKRQAEVLSVPTVSENSTALSSLF
ncbi:hypothetical protein CLOM621_08610 [Clostridium sp. M62/1]|nr:hypothetical protein CLOM621_08610 [Clostridium sp. M62/1]